MNFQINVVNMGNPSISERAFATHTTIQRDMLDTVSSRVSLLKVLVHVLNEYCI